MIGHWDLIFLGCMIFVHVAVHTCRLYRKAGSHWVWRRSLTLVTMACTQAQVHSRHWLSEWTGWARQSRQMRLAANWSRFIHIDRRIYWIAHLLERDALRFMECFGRWVMNFPLDSAPIGWALVDVQYGLFNIQLNLSLDAVYFSDSLASFSGACTLILKSCLRLYAAKQFAHPQSRVGAL